MIRAHPLHGRRAAIATMHGKERAVGPKLKQWFNIDLETAEDVDTDALGTFTGEIPRLGQMLDSARAKALMAIEKTGASIGLGSEGAYARPKASVGSSICQAPTENCFICVTDRLCFHSSRR